MDHKIITRIIKELNVQSTKCSELESIRMKSIIKRLNRLNNGELNHSDDITDKEKVAQTMLNLKNYICKKWESCEDIRNKCEWEGVDYFYHSYATIPGVDYDTFRDFIRSKQCLCGKC